MAVRDRSNLQTILVNVLDHAGAALDQNRYRLVGTGAALLQGVHLPIGDVDLLMKEREDVDRFCAAAASLECLAPPTHLVDAKQYFANFRVDGIEVNVSTVEWETNSDGIECFGRGPWEHFSLIACGAYVVPAVALELRLISELIRDRPDRYTPLIAHLRAHGYNTALVRRGMVARGIPQTLQDTILDQLAMKRGHIP